MKLIDEKGRIFGKLNIIDLLVLLLAVAIIIVVAVKFGGKSSGGQGQSNAALLTYTVQVQGVEPEVYDSVCEYVDLAQNKKDQLMSNGDLLNAYVIDVTAEEYQPYVEDSLFNGGEADNRLTLTFTIQAEVDDSVTDTVGSQEVRIGKSHIVKTTHFELTSGTILTCVWGNSDTAS